jgi:hypothetical protein
MMSGDHRLGKKNPAASAVELLSKSRRDHFSTSHDMPL